MTSWFVIEMMRGVDYERGQNIPHFDFGLSSYFAFQQFLGLSMISATMTEFEFSPRSSDVGLPWEMHIQIKVSTKMHG